LIVWRERTHLKGSTKKAEEKAPLFQTSIRALKKSRKGTNAKGVIHVLPCNRSAHIEQTFARKSGNSRSQEAKPTSEGSFRGSGDLEMKLLKEVKNA